MKVRNGDDVEYHARLTWRDVTKIGTVVGIVVTALVAGARYVGADPEGVAASENRMTRIEMALESTQASVTETNHQITRLADAIERHIESSRAGFERLAIQEARTADLHHRLMNIERERDP